MAFLLYGDSQPAVREEFEYRPDAQRGQVPTAATVPSRNDRGPVARDSADPLALSTGLQPVTGLWQNFDHVSVYMMPGLPVTDRVHLSQRGKWIFAQDLAGLVVRALN